MATDETVYVGESKNLKDRLWSHQKRNWHCHAGFTYLAQPTSTLPHQLKEMENDGEMPTDDRRRAEKRVQELTDEFIKKLDEHLADKEREILTV